MSNFHIIYNKFWSRWWNGVNCQTLQRNFSFSDRIFAWIFLLEIFISQHTILYFNLFIDALLNGNQVFENGFNPRFYVLLSSVCRIEMEFISVLHPLFNRNFSQNKINGGIFLFYNKLWCWLLCTFMEIQLCISLNYTVAKNCLLL